MRQAVFYEQDGDTGQPLPMWLMIEKTECLDWNSTLYVQLDAPFEQFLFDDCDIDSMALSVPDHVYVRNLDDPSVFGIHLPALRAYVQRIAALAEHPFSLHDLSRLMLRISDIEDTLQVEVRDRVQWDRSDRR
ncbi:hypothetical protein D3P07_23225 [Paenibacillus sp. 1011MAR3C5]|uniref:hypothetical protein n=1 Tax=Paenibacillus sp. 1011MAR3C5 TaxID=1675787 RepID=UPI000E6C9837|nr:hypothetical protein [Paenibacillus sp. 1011MAR3C5]RJE84283.1 hypothetical protein D3P07_23225 [Paenibacillus sp. 1011MAR3C5]